MVYQPSNESSLCESYFYHPLKEDKRETNTIVPIIYLSEPPIVCDFDWVFDNFEEFTARLVQDEELAEDKVEDFKNFLKKTVIEEKKKQREVREAREKTIEKISPETKAAFENSPFIDRYYVYAHAVV